MAGPINVVPPLAVSDAMLLATDVPEADYPAWAVGTTYALAARVIVASEHSIYESAADGNVGNDPTTSPLWSVVGPTNRWALFDRSNSTQTSQAVHMSYQLQPGLGVNAIAALNVRGCNSVTVQLVHPSLGTVYDHTFQLASLPLQAGWWEWFFGQRNAPRLMLAFDLPGIPGCTLQVDFHGTSELAVGVLLIGQATQIGFAVQAGAKVGIQDYSRKETDDFGNTDLVPRAFAKRASFNALVATARVDELSDFLAELRATPALWVGALSVGATAIYGFYNQFDITLDNTEFSQCSIDIEGLT